MSAHSRSHHRAKRTHKPGYDTWTGPLVPRLEATNWMSPSLCTVEEGGVNVSLVCIAAKSLSQLHLSEPPSMKLAHVSISTLFGRMWYMPFMADEPPSTLPRGHESCLAPAWVCLTVWYCQSYDVPGRPS